MNVYIITLILAVTLANAADRRPVELNAGLSLIKKKKASKFNLFVFLCIAVLVFVAGLRHRIGTDYTSYEVGYYDRIDYWFTALLRWEEPGLGFIGAVGSIFYNAPYTMFFNAALLTIVLYVWTIRKYSVDFGLGIALYILIGCWHGSFNGVRQYLAAAVLFAGHRFMFERKFWKWALVVFAATLFHRTALVMLPIYFVADGIIDWKRVVAIIIGGIVLLTSSDLLFSIMTDLRGSDQTANAYAQRAVNPLRIAVCFAPILLLILKSKDFLKNPENAFYSKMLIVSALFMLGTSQSAYLNRVGIYTEMYATLALPRILGQLRTKNKNSFIVITVGLYLIYWIYEINVRGTLLPWRWVF